MVNNFTDGYTVICTVCLVGVTRGGDSDYSYTLWNVQNLPDHLITAEASYRTGSQVEKDGGKHNVVKGK